MLLLLTAPNHDRLRGPKFLMPSMTSHGEISRVSWILKPWGEGGVMEEREGDVIGV